MKVGMYITFLLRLLLRLTTQAASQSCPGKKYSGNFQINNFKANKVIIGYSYKNLTISSAQECFSHCISDCKCLSYQTFDETRCELLDEDQNTATLQPYSGYRFYRLSQSFKDGDVTCASGGCRNGCCHSNPCINGGTCQETCQTARQKFKCICPVGFQGKYCQFVVSCVGVPGRPPKSGVYTITRPSLTSQFKVYCDFTSEPNFVWTLVESFEYSKKSVYMTRKFYDNHPVNEESPNWVDYRLPLDDMKHIRNISTHWRAVCNFNSTNISTTDYVRIEMKNVDVMEAVDSGCFHVGFLRLNGTTCTTNCVTKLETSRYHPFLSPCTYDGCKFGGCPSNQVKYEAFGAYDAFSSQHDCSSSSTSTTSYWIGYKLN